MLDYLIKGANVVDGTGAPGRVTSVGVQDGRIVSIGDEADVDSATETIDAEGLVLAPGFVDPHTHYDAQLHWDPFASPSNLHGVTSVIAGNCGFTLAPVKPDDADWLRRMMAQVEGMSLSALENGVDWNWQSYADFLAGLDGKVGVNVGFLVGHCALRRYVMGPEATGNEADADQLAAIERELRTALEAGGLGFSTTQAFTHSDGDGEPVPSRFASNDEVLAMSKVVSEYEGTTLEIIIDGCLNGFSDGEIEYLTALSTTAQRPINWNVLTVDSREPDKFERQLEASSYAAEHGGRVVALTMPILVPMNMSFLNHCALFLMPGWSDVMHLSVPERIAELGDPDVRRSLDEGARSEAAGVLRRLSDWEDYYLGETFASENKPLEKRRIGDIAAERGRTPFDTLVDIVIADELRTVLWPTPPENDDESWRMRADLWRSGRAMIGGSDAGAHLDRMMGTAYPTKFLGDCIRGRQLVSLEEAVHFITQVPAELFGLRNRGTIAEGNHADLVLFDPETIDAGPVHTLTDLPGDAARLYSEGIGIEKVFVNGRPIIDKGEPTGELPGTVLRAGRDTYTVLP